MTIWDDHDVEDKVLEVLADVNVRSDFHEFGRPYISAYQLALELHRRHPGVAAALNQPLGGAGVGRRNSLSQYLAQQLSRRIGEDANYPVDGAFMSNQDVETLTYRGRDGAPVTSSLTDSGFDLSLFRLRT